MVADDATIARWRAMATQFPVSELPRFSLGMALQAAGRSADAAAVFDEAAALRPDMMMAWLHAAQCLTAGGRWVDARSRTVEALRLAEAQGHRGPFADATALLAEIDDELGA